MVNFFYISSNFDGQDKMKLLAKFLIKICTWCSEPPYCFENLRWLSHLCTEFFQTLPKVASYLANQNLKM